MIARFNMSKSLRHVLNYNENKVSEGTARCIGAEGFGMDAGELNFKQKKARFTELTSRNRPAKTNIAHITLSFARGEKLSSQKLLNIADIYMKKVGFGDQPYLVYQHHDTANTHIHIVSTNIKADGGRIDTHMIGATLSSQARVEIEQEFGLVRAAGRGESYHQGIPPLDLQAYLAAGKKGKASISAVVRAVISHYKFTSLPQYNAILRQFNVVADPGQEGSVLQQKRGLLYSAIDARGEKVGSQIRASAIYVPGWSGLPDNAGLTLLSAKFTRDRYRRRALRNQLLRKVELSLQGGVTMAELQHNLKIHGVAIALRYNVEGRLSGATFIDNEAGVVFKGSDLKKSLGAAGLAARLVTATKLQRKVAQGYFAAIMRHTDFTPGFKAVLQHWRQRGITIEARVHQDGDVFFFMETSRLAPPVALPVPPRIDSYLRANLERQEQRQRQMPEEAAEARHASFMNAIHYYGQAGQMRMSLIMELLHAEETYNYLPAALLREAKKKKRRGRSP